MSVDSRSRINHLSLFSGAGGLDLAVRLAVPNARLVCAVEVEPYAAAILATRMQEGAMDEAPIWNNILTFDARPWRGVVDLVVGGFPCQDISNAGKRAGIGGGAQFSGEKWRASFATWSHGMHSWKTSELSLFEESTEFSGRWPRSGSMRNGECFRQPRSVRRTNVSDFSFWRTPTVGQENHDRGSVEYAQRMMESGHTISLADQAKVWPTPQAHDSANPKTPDQIKEMRMRGHGVSNLNEAASMWPTPRGSDGEKGGPNQHGSSGDLMLPSAAAKFHAEAPEMDPLPQGPWDRHIGQPVSARPTPAARDWKDGRSSEETRNRNARPLNEVAISLSSHPDPATPTPGDTSRSGSNRPQLNANFVDWLMG